jgi:thioredoxin-related protein
MTLRILILTGCMALSILSRSQDLSKYSAYNPVENASDAIANAVKEAKEKGKHVLIQVGGNWCIWCARFDEFTKGDADINTYIENNYVRYHLNYSKENKNKEVLAKYGYPQRFGFPVFLILDGEGNLIHTENSAYLEDGKGYGKLKVIEFLKNWCKAAFDPAQYKEEK